MTGSAYSVKNEDGEVATVTGTPFSGGSKAGDTASFTVSLTAKAMKAGHYYRRNRYQEYSAQRKRQSRNGPQMLFP